MDIFLKRDHKWQIFSFIDKVTMHCQTTISFACLEAEFNIEGSGSEFGFGKYKPLLNHCIQSL